MLSGIRSVESDRGKFVSAPLACMSCMHVQAFYLTLTADGVSSSVWSCTGGINDAQPLVTVRHFSSNIMSSRIFKLRICDLPVTYLPQSLTPPQSWGQHVPSQS